MIQSLRHGLLRAIKTLKMLNAAGMFRALAMVFKVLLVVLRPLMHLMKLVPWVVKGLARSSHLARKIGLKGLVDAFKARVPQQTRLEFMRRLRKKLGLKTRYIRTSSECVESPDDESPDVDPRGFLLAEGAAAEGAARENGAAGTGSAAAAAAAAAAMSKEVEGGDKMLPDESCDKCMQIFGCA
jgi:hypothetical protein